MREALPKDYQYIIDELLHTSGEEHDKQEYYRNIIDTVIEVGQAEAFIVALCNLIKRMAVDRLHVVGDIYDRGNHADRILDMLREHHHVDIQWGNHDIVWMGAAAGSPACVATVLNSALQYNTLSIVENTYGISLRDLIGFAQETYRDSTWFMPRNPDDAYYVKNSMDNLAKAHKAIAIILFKLEGQLIRRHPEFGMEDRLVLDRIDYENNTVTLNGETYPLNDGHFPTIDPADPYALTDAEASLIESLTNDFRHSQALRKHVEFLYADGALYKVCNGNLLFHGCVPMTSDGQFETVTSFDGISLRVVRGYDMKYKREIMSMDVLYGYKTVYPEFYDAALKGKYSEDTTTAEMIDLIMAGRVFEFSFQFGEYLASLPYMFRNCLFSNSTDLASTLQKNKKALNKKLNKIKCPKK